MERTRPLGALIGVGLSEAQQFSQSSVSASLPNLTEKTQSY
jgi:hypothetical protein